MTRSALPMRPVDQTGTALATAHSFAFGELVQMAEGLAASGIMPNLKTQAQALTLMLLCQADGLHPVMAIRRYHILDDGRFTMQAAAMQAEFQRIGGTFRPIQIDETAARAWVQHPTLLPEGMEFEFTYDQAERSGIVAGKYGIKVNWRSSRADMLWARLVTKTVRKVAPGIVAGIYTPDELADVEAADSPAASIQHERRSAAQAVAAVETQVPGQPAPGHDPRPYFAVVGGAAAAFAVDPWTIHQAIAMEALRVGSIKGPLGRRAAAIRALTDLYRADREWIRKKITEWGERQYIETTATPTPTRSSEEADKEPSDTTPAAPTDEPESDTDEDANPDADADEDADADDESDPDIDLPY